MMWKQFSWLRPFPFTRRRGKTCRTRKQTFHPLPLAVEPLESRCLLNGTPTLRIDPGEYRVFEDHGTLNVRVTLSHALSSDVTFGFQTSDGPAIHDADYAPRAGQGRILANTTFTDIGIPIVPSEAPEGDEFFTVNIFSPSANANLGTPTTATVTIFVSLRQGCLNHPG